MTGDKKKKKRREVVYLAGGDRNERSLCMIRELDMTVQGIGNGLLCQTDTHKTTKTQVTQTLETR